MLSLWVPRPCLALPAWVWCERTGAARSLSHPRSLALRKSLGKITFIFDPHRNWLPRCFMKTVISCQDEKPGDLMFENITLVPPDKSQKPRLHRMDVCWLSPACDPSSSQPPLALGPGPFVIS